MSMRSREPSGTEQDDPRAGLWDADKVAAFLGYSPLYFSQKVKRKPGFPKPMPGFRSSLWKSEQIVEWAMGGDLEKVG